ncbi:MAG: S-layer protein [Meiothermus sp.]|uniref:S-layer homology domain-containing protein n=1 Tax=Meiothermus sp. TaxID=1955249 RepID=UPI0021DBFD19|nr:S-layer homology domain-containing protein [Meiothermus sp.]GIW29366.1 MAG: S-layer protein [Meiothermus sp.]
MKKKLVVYLAGLLTVLGLGFGQAQFSDVPAGHWAKEAVERIAACGLITGFPDGTYRGNTNLTRYQAALIFQRLLTELQQGGECVKGQGGMSEEDMTAIRNAVQELAAELAALGVRVSALEDNAASKDDIARLEAAIEELKAMKAEPAGMDEAALADLADRVEAASVAADTALAQAQVLAERLDGVEGDVAALKTQVEADADSIRALNELAVLLNQDVLSLQDRVTALEKQLGDVDFEGFANREDVSAIQEFATALRSDLVRLSDRVSALDTRVGALDQRVATLESNAFTISGSLGLTYQVKRAWGAGDIFDIDRLYTSNFSTGDSDGDGLTVDEVDMGQVEEGKTTASLSVKFSFKDRTAVSDPGKLNTYPGLVNFSINASVTNPVAGTSYPALNLTVNTISTTLKVADGQALTFTFGQSVKNKFTEYVFDNDAVSRGHGFVANAPFLLGGTTTVVYGSKGANDGDNTYFRAIRSTFGVGPINVGASFAQEGLDQQAGGGVESPARTAYGIDLKTSLGPINLIGEYFGTADNIAAPNPAVSGTGFYIRADAGVGPLTLSGNYRNIGAAITAANMLSGDANFTAGSSNNAAPFANDQTGFGITAGATLGIFKLNGYLQNYTYGGASKAAGSYSALGATATFGLGPITLEGFYKNASSGGVDQNTVPDEKPGTGTYPSNWGVKVTAALALGAANVNATGFYTNNYVAGTTSLGAYGDVNLDLGAAKVKAIGRYNDSASTVTTKFGVQVSTQPLLFGASLMAEGATRTTGTTNETVYALGVKLANFLFANSSFEVKYGAYDATNVASVLVGSTSKAFDPSVNDIYSTSGTNTGGVKGLYFTWTYWDLVFSYADLDVVNNGNATHGQGFKIAYKVNF